MTGSGTSRPTRRRVRLGRSGSAVTWLHALSTWTALSITTGHAGLEAAEPDVAWPWLPGSSVSSGHHSDKSSRVLLTRTGAGSVCGPYSPRFTLDGIDLNDVDPQKAAGEAVDPDRLLEGEDPETRHPEEANHWIEVYTELLTFKERAVATAHQSVAQMPEVDARVEATRTDMAVLEAERDRIRRRLDFWKRRHLDLSTP